MSDAKNCPRCGGSGKVAAVPGSGDGTTPVEAGIAPIESDCRSCNGTGSIWSQATMNALAAWAGQDTWRSLHALDEGRFFDFVLAVWDQTGCFWSEEISRDIIIAELRKLGEWNDSNADHDMQVVSDRVQSGSRILLFLDHVKDTSNRTL